MVVVTLWRTMQDSIVALCVWWALWSLADANLLAFSPTSEIVVLCTCAVVKFGGRVFRYMCARLNDAYARKIAPLVDRV